MKNLFVRIKWHEVKLEIALSLGYVYRDRVEFLDISLFLVAFHALYGTAIVAENQVLNYRLVDRKLHLGVKVESFILRQLI